MKTTLITLATALALGLAGCDRNPAPKASQTPNSPSSSTAGSSAAPSAPQSNTPTTPANAGTPSQAEKREGAVPQQGQVDPKEPAQRKDFQQKSGG